MYRSARGTKHFGYRHLDADADELSVPIQRSVTSVHPKRHERRTAEHSSTEASTAASAGRGFALRIHGGRSAVATHKVAPLVAPAAAAAAANERDEELLINLDDDCPPPPAPSTASAGRINCFRELYASGLNISAAQ